CGLRDVARRRDSARLPPRARLPASRFDCWARVFLPSRPWTRPPLRDQCPKPIEKTGLLSMKLRVSASPAGGLTALRQEGSIVGARGDRVREAPAGVERRVGANSAPARGPDRPARR